MERYDVSEGARLAEMVEAAGHGHEVVITASGRRIARIVVCSTPEPEALTAKVDGAADLIALDQVRATFPKTALDLDWSAELSAMRDEERF